MPDNKLMENLIKALQYEYRTYSAILKIAERKTDCLVKNDIEALTAITDEENQAAEQTFKLNQVREQLLLKICEETGQDFKKITLETLKEQAQEPYRKMLEEVRTRLNEVVAKLIARNGINQKLLENSVKYIDFSMQLMSSPQPSVPLYGRSGQEVSHNPKRSLLDVKF